MSNSLLEIDNLRALSESKNLTLVYGNLKLDDTIGNKIYVPGIKDFNSLLDITNNGVLFYKYIYFDIDEHVISISSYEKYDDSLQGQLELEVDGYNESLSKVNFDKPAYLILGCIMEGVLIYTTIENEDIMEFDVGEVAFDDIYNDILNRLPEEEFESVMRKSEEAIEIKQNELKKIIFADPEFKKSTNIDLRKQYTSMFFTRNPEYREESVLNNSFPIHFIERIWKEFKAEGLHK